MSATKDIKIIQNNNRTFLTPLNYNDSFINKMIDKTNFNSKYKDEILSSDIKVGLEFEFYLKDENKLSSVFSALLSYGKQVMYCPIEHNIKDKPDNVWTIERDRTLTSDIKLGYEVVSPKMSVKEGMFYLKDFLTIINQYGITNDDCGLHFHISTDEPNMRNMDASKLFLFLSENKTLESWKPRENYNRSVQNLFNSVSLDDFNENYREISRFHNIAPRHTEDDKRKNRTNHIEIRGPGGEGYERKSAQIIKDFEETITAYYIACNEDLEQEKHNILKNEFNSKEIQSTSLTFNEILEEAKMIEGFDNLSKHEKRDTLEILIYNYEDEGRFVPIRRLLKEVDEYVKFDLKNSTIDNVINNEMSLSRNIS